MIRYKSEVRIFFFYKYRILKSQVFRNRILKGHIFILFVQEVVTHII